MAIQPCKKELIKAIQAHLQRLYHWQVPDEHFLFLPGVVISFNLATQALAQPGGSVVFMTPVYMPFFELAKNAGLQQVTVDLLRDETGRYTDRLGRFRGSHGSPAKPVHSMQSAQPGGAGVHPD